jgi:hypothetical protein
MVTEYYWWAYLQTGCVHTRDKERHAVKEDMEVTEEEERGVVDSDVEGFSIALADLDPAQGDLFYSFMYFQKGWKFSTFHYKLNCIIA